MRLQGRDLEPNMRGEDVGLLQAELARLGFSITDREGLFGETTLAAVRELQNRHGIDPVTGIVDARTAALINRVLDLEPRDSYLVRGKILRADGEPVSDVRVNAFDVGLRREERIGTSPVDEQGNYEILYPIPETPHFAIILRVLAADGNVLVSSNVLCPVKPVETVDLIVGGELRGLSEFREIEGRIRPVLEAESVRPDDLTDEDLDLLSCRQQLDRERLVQYIAALRLMSRTRLPALAIYGLARQNFSPRLPVLLKESLDVLRSALERAVEENQIPQDSDREIESFFRRLRGFAVEQGFLRPEREGSFSLSELLSTAGVSRDQQQEILTRYVERGEEEDIEDFWQRLHESGTLDESAVQRVQLTLQLGALTGNQVPLVRTIVERHRPESVRDLVRLNRSDWLDLIQSSDATEPPPGTPGDSEEERQENYARVITSMVEEAFPTAFLAARWAENENNGFNGQDEVVEFLNRNADFSFESDRIDRYLEELGEAALEGVSDPERLQANLRAIGRLVPIAGPVERHTTLQPLLAAGFDSAVAIDRAGSGFLSRFRDILGVSGAEKISRAARQQVAMAHTLFGQFSPVMHRALPQAIGPHSLFWADLLPDLPDIPDWQSLFGHAGFCACRHCASIHGPAAYLVDLLAFVRNQDALSSLTSAGRRPDLVEIELSCHNTNTPLPYIDLVNEVLGEAVAPSGGPALQTTASAEELRAQPEHRNHAAEAELEESVYPWKLPFSRPAEEARAYLHHLDIPRHRLMEAFQPEGEEAAPTQLEIGSDRLGLTPIEHQILVGEDLNPPRSLQEFWGLPGLSVNQLRNRLVRPRSFLRQSELSYDEALELFATRFVSPGADVEIEFEEGSCNLETALIVPQPSQQRLDRVHRFERLRRRLDWSFFELDRAIAAFSPGEIDDNLLLALSGFQELRETLDLPFEEMLAWWSPVDTFDYELQSGATKASQYRRVFQNPVIFDSETLELFELDDTGGELRNNAEPLGDHLPALAAALGAKTEELSLVAGPEALLNLDDLSELYRTVSFIRAHGISVRDFLVLRELSGVDPFQSPAQCIHFRSRLKELSQAGFTLAETEYLLRHRQPPGIPTGPSEVALTLLLRRLQEALQGVRKSYQAVEDVDGAATGRALGALLEEPNLGSALGLIREGVLLPSGDPEDFLQEHLFFLDTAAALEALVGSEDDPPELDPGTQVAERFAFVLGPLVVHLHETLGRSALIQTLSTEFDLSPAMLSSLLGEEIAVFEAPVFLDQNQELTRTQFPELFSILDRLWKVSTIVSRLGLTDREFDFFLAHSEQLQLLDLQSLPNVAPDASESSEWFAGFVSLIELVRLSRSLPAGESHLFDLLEHASTFDPDDDAEAAAGAFLQELHQMTGWGLDNLSFLAGEEGLALRFPEDYQNGHAVRRFHACFGALERLGLASAHVIPEWITTDVSPAAARAIRGAAKSKYDPVQWLQVARSINDPLRERLRDALVGHLLAPSSGFDDTADLYGHFLIDPEMSACQLTSRIRQAISSVQLFVQRSLLNLEPSLSLSREAAEEWEWMKRYRVWEANRKIFLYPENWIEPELRSDSTPLFRDFQKALLQGDVTERSLETAVSTYVTGLAEIARPEICSIYRDPRSHTHHLFARTRELPHIYYHRRWERSRTWTPWERIPVDIEGEHLVPALIGQRFYLFWPVLQEMNEPPNNPDKNAKKFREVRLAWSIWQDHQWTAKRLSKASLKLSGVPPLDRYMFRAVQRFGEPQSFGVFEGFGGGGSSPVDFSGVPRKIAVRLLAGPQFSQELGRFQLKADGSIEVESLTQASVLSEPGPAGGLFSGMAIVEISSRPLILPTGETDALGNAKKTTVNHLRTLEETPGKFRIVYPHQFEGFVTQSAFTYEDGRATFLVQPIQRSGVTSPGGSFGGPSLTVGIRHTHGITPDDTANVFPLALERVSNTLGITGAGVSAESDDFLAVTPFASASGPPNKEFLFLTHYHPHADQFVSALFEKGLDGLLGRLDLQVKGSTSFFEDRYEPIPKHVAAPFPLNGVDFSSDGAYSVYNWELFFHIPLLVAEWLHREQRFAEAQRWYHYIFDPTRCEGASAPRCYWKVRPFFDYDLSDPESQPIQDLMKVLSEGNPALSRQVQAWRDNPFKPHAIARLRPIAYQKTVVMKYLENLIAWADSLFLENSLEALNEASQLYVLAAQILGPRPEEIDTGERPAVRTFSEIEESLDAFSNALIEIEDNLGPNGYVFTNDLAFGDGGSPPTAPPLGTILYFCIPGNDKLIKFWDTIEDRLFKLRHCMNIEGVVRELPLFAPPIEPGLLVKAAAAGVDITSALADLHAPLGPYRFSLLIEKALEFNGVVRNLGSLFLDALAQRDGETLSRLRATHEVELLKAIRAVKERQLDEAGEQLVALRRSSRTVEERRVFYKERPDRIAEETEHLSEMEAAGRLQEQAMSHDLTSADAARFIPDFALGWSGAGPLASASLGRANVLAFFEFRSQEKSAGAAKATHSSNLAGIRGVWSRRSDDWEFLSQQASSEIRQINKQIAAAEIREAVAQKELEAHDRQTEQSESVEAFMSEKYTDEELYNWRVSQLSSLYFQAYQLAHDLARKAERAYRHELGIQESSFIDFGNWDNLRKGLLAGERLELQLRRLQNAYLETNRRHYELTKHVSLGMLNPIALLRLREEGSCEIELPEEVFDLDHPGHYFRRIRSVSLTLPSVTGPYTTLSCTLRLLQSSVRRDSTLVAGQYRRDHENDDPRFSDTFGSVQSIATSNGQNDSGLFEFDFRDERYLPFEGAGVISRWSLEMPDQFRQFDYGSISDVILHINYTAREGGAVLRDAAIEHLNEGINTLVTGDEAPGLHQLVSMRHDFPTQLHRLLRVDEESEQQSVTISLSTNRFPYLFRTREIEIDQVHIFIELSDGFADADVSGSELTLTHPGGEEVIDLGAAVSLRSLRHVSVGDVSSQPGEWSLALSAVGSGLADDAGQLNPETIRDIHMVLHYSVN